MNYWERRQQQLNSQLEKDEAKLKKRLSSFYDSEYRKLEKEIASYYQKYGENNVIQYRKLMESLPEEDKRLLIERMEEFADKYPQYEDMLPVRESIYKLNRLEGLQMSIRLQQIEIGAVDNTQLQEHLEKQAVRGVNAAAETLGFGKNFYGVDSAVVKSVVNMAWANGENFSISIWKNTNKLANYLCTDIAQAIARGDSYDKVAKNMKKRFGDVSRNDMYRLIYTEGTYVMAESTMQPFTEDFEKYQISTVGDGKVCSICSGVAHEIFEIKDRKPGVNFPPFHPWCRCTFIIVVDDWNKWMDGYEKKHGNGQAEKVAKRFNGGIIKSIDIDDYEVIVYGKNISTEINELILNVIQLREENDGFFISKVNAGSIPGGRDGVPVLQIEPFGIGLLQLNLNTDILSGRSLSEINEIFKNSEYSTVNTLEEALIHECGHAKLIKGMSIRDIENLYSKLKKIHIEGISRCAYSDGIECIAETEVLLSRGQKIPKDAMKLYNEYMKGK